MRMRALFPCGGASLVLALTALGLTACGGQPPSPQHPVSFYLEGDPGTELAGVEVFANGQSIGVSGDTGLLQAVLEGAEGAAFEISWTCPDGHRQPEDTQSLRLREFEQLDPEAESGLSMTLGCPPTDRNAAFVVRTNGREGLPVMVNGEELGRTGSTGVAHIVLAGAPGSTYRVQLATADQALLRPQNPSQTYTLGDADDVFVMNQDFESAEPPRRVRRRSNRRRRPRRIQRVPLITRLD